jgi:Fe-S-cluster-containing dehydrogenase component/CRP-like cAMP-binding protein
MSDIATMARPQRWDAPFDPNMSEAELAMLLARPEFSSIDEALFPASMPLEGILRNDCRVVKFRAGDIVIREGDYGNSAFLLLKGTLKAVIPPGFPQEVLGRSAAPKRTLWNSLSQLWTNPELPEVRDTSRYTGRHPSRGDGEDPQNRMSLLELESARCVFREGTPIAKGLREVPPLKEDYRTATLSAGSIFGEIAALGRVPRTATVYAQTDSTVLEIRWQGLSAIRKYDSGWRRIIDESYRRNQLKTQLREHPFLAKLDEATLQQVADRTRFETYGSFEWHLSYKRKSGAGTEEPVIAREGDYNDGLLLIGAGFARCTVRVGNGRRTLTYLRKGDSFGLDELYATWKTGQKVPLETSLFALGYVHVLRVPADAVNQYVFPDYKPRGHKLVDEAARPLSNDVLLEWAVNERFINGTQTMLIDIDKCVRCDDCVRACAATHGGNPRFVRHGKTLDRYMVTNACMHCVDPVCMIGCPTGAIHRDVEKGVVVINDDTCIGCGTCANSCPYDNIRLVEIRDKKGRPVLDPQNQMPILKATKCDLCYTQLGGPACVRACPHDALQRVDFREGTLFSNGMG